MWSSSSSQNIWFNRKSGNFSRLFFQSFVLTCFNTCFVFWLYFQTSSGSASSPNISDLENWWGSNIYTHGLSAHTHRHTRTLQCQKCTGISIWNTHTQQSGTQYHARKNISYVAEVNNEYSFFGDDVTSLLQQILDLRQSHSVMYFYSVSNRWVHPLSRAKIWLWNQSQTAKRQS